MSFVGKWYGFGQDPLFDEGVRAFEGGFYAASAGCFREVLQGTASKDLKSQAKAFLVNALAAQGREKLREDNGIEAREAFREAIEHEPRYPDLWLGLAMAAGRTSDEATEKGAVEKARELNPTYSRAILYEAMIALKEGCTQQAAEILGRLPEGTAPTGPDDLLIQALQATFDTEGDEANLLAGQGDDAMKEGQCDIAAALYRQAAQLRPLYADVRCKLAQALLELDHLEEAESHLHAAVEINPSYVDALAHLGICLKRQGRRAEAKQIFQRAYELDKHHPIAKMEVRRIF